MNTVKLAQAINFLSLALGDLSEALTESEAGERTSSRVEAPAATTGAVEAQTPPPELSPFEDETPTWTPPEIPAMSERERVMAECPVHFTPWRVKEAGISRNGKPYGAFWKCNGKNDDGSYCSKKPDAGWVKTHDPERALASA